MSSAEALRAFRWTYVAFIVSASTETVPQPPHDRSSAHAHLAAAVPLLALTEIAAALLLLSERAEILACVLLLSVYAAAAAISLAQGVVPLRFVYYAASACYIVVAHRRLSAPTGLAR